MKCPLLFFFFNALAFSWVVQGSKEIFKSMEFSMQNVDKIKKKKKKLSKDMNTVINSISINANREKHKYSLTHTQNLSIEM